VPVRASLASLERLDAPLRLTGAAAPSGPRLALGNRADIRGYFRRKTRTVETFRPINTGFAGGGEGGNEMTDQQVTGTLVLAAMTVIFLGVWFFGHPDDRGKNLQRMKMFLLLLVTLIGLAWVAYSVIDLAIGLVNGTVGADVILAGVLGALGVTVISLAFRLDRFLRERGH
jgi:hypothetical protein